MFKQSKNELNVTDDRNIDCLIIYPDMENGIDELSLTQIDNKKRKIEPYYKVFN